MSKVISIDALAVIRKKNLPLSNIMVKTLLSACDKQSKKEAFGPKDIKGSFLSLINRGLLNTEEKTVNGKAIITWHVTKSAVETLRNLGINVTC
jgi:hypothetical protein